MCRLHGKKQKQVFPRFHQLEVVRKLLASARKVGAGRSAERSIAVFNPYTEQQIGRVPKATLEEVRAIFARAHAYKPTLTRFERAAILNKGKDPAGVLLAIMQLDSSLRSE